MSKYPFVYLMREKKDSYIDKMFEMGDIEGISANDLKHFLRKRTNEKLVELGETEAYEPLCRKCFYTHSKK